MRKGYILCSPEIMHDELFKRALKKVFHANVKMSNQGLCTRVEGESILMDELKLGEELPQYHFRISAPIANGELLISNFERL